MIVYQMAAGDFSGLSEAIPAYLDARGNSWLMHYAMMCSDDPNTSYSVVDTDTATDPYVALDASDTNQYVDSCPVLGLDQLPDGSDALVESAIPTLLLQGGLDPATPMSGGDVVAAGLSNSFNIVFPAGGHVQGAGACGIAIMDAFLTDPTTQPDTSCVPQTFEFAAPHTVTVTSDDGAVSLVVTLPDIFPGTAAAPGTYSNANATAVITVGPA